MKHSLKLLAAAIALASTQSAFAKVDLDGAVTANIAQVYATELMAAATNIITNSGGGTGTELNAETAIGFGIAAGQDRFFRYDLTNGTFATAALTSATLTVGGGGGGGGAPVTLVSGGQVDDNFAIFQVTGTGAELQDTRALLAITSVAATATSAPIELAFGMYDTVINAATANPAGLIPGTSQSADLATFGSGVVFTASETRTNTASVAASPVYTQFATASAGTSLPATTATTAPFAFLTWDASGALNPVASAATAVGDFLTAGASITVTGSDLTPFTTAPGAFFIDDTSQDCSTPNAAYGPTLTATTAVFTIGAAGLVTGSEGVLCATADTTTPIAEQTFSASADADGTTATAGSVLTASTGAIIRDGTVLKAPFAQGFTNTSTFINLMNTSNNDATYTTRCLSALSNAAAVGSTGSVPAGESMRLAINTFGCPTGQGYNALELTFDVPAGSVTGTVVRESAGNGGNGFSDMTGNQ